MKIEKQLCEIISQKEMHKLNIMSYNLSPVEDSSKRVTYIRNLAISKFYNSNNIRTRIFHKRTSLLITSAAYEAFFRK